MGMRVSGIGYIVVFFFFDARLISAQTVSGFGFGDEVCQLVSIKDVFLGVNDGVGYDGYNSKGANIIEGDNITLEQVYQWTRNNNKDYVAVLFYASWCPFSKSFRPVFVTLSSLYPSLRHFAVEESSIRPSMLSRYEVHGYPTLVLLNSTMLLHYHSSRDLNSVISFYSGVTGIKPLDQKDLEASGNQSNFTKLEDMEQENCPFSWAKSPENMLRQEMYLILATTFVILKFMYILLPCMYAHACALRRHFRITNLRTLCEPPLALCNQVTQLFKGLKEPCKRSNLQEGALSARAWASKSLASVSIGEASSSRGSERQ